MPLFTLTSTCTEAENMYACHLDRDTFIAMEQVLEIQEAIHSTTPSHPQRSIRGPPSVGTLSPGLSPRCKSYSLSFFARFEIGCSLGSEN